jgi:hypothetical protein
MQQPWLEIFVSSSCTARRKWKIFEPTQETCIVEGAGEEEKL